jgi:predicted permease
VPVVNVAAVAMLAPRRGAGVWLAIARNPLVIACVAGLAWNAAAIPMPGVVAKVLELLAGAALARPRRRWCGPRIRAGHAAVAGNRPGGTP